MEALVSQGRALMLDPLPQVLDLNLASLNRTAPQYGNINSPAEQFD
jgi:hypothetical protein